MAGTGTGDGTVTTHVARLPGMAKGETGTAGNDKPGPSIRVMAVSPVLFIFVEVGWVYIHTFLGLLTIDGMGLVDLAPAADAFNHLLNVGSIALAPSAVALLKELLDYLGKLRAARQ